MIRYTASDLVKSARQIADLENSDFISWNENIRLLNESYTGLYQKLINKGEQSFVCSFFTNEKEIPLPCDFWQLKQISVWNNGNIMPVLRRSDSTSFNSCYYKIKDGVIYIHGQFSSELLVEYYKVPKTLTFPPKNKELPFDYAPVAANDKTYLLSNGTIYDMEENEIVKETEFSGEVPTFLTDNVVVDANGNFELIYDVTPETENDRPKVIFHNKVYDYSEGKLYFLGTDFVYGTLEEQVEFGDYKLALTENLEDFWFIGTDGSLFHDEVIEGVKIKDARFLDGKLIVITATGTLAKIDYDNEVRIIDLPSKQLCINKFDYDTGYGITVFYKNKYYIESFIEDTVLNFPNSFYYELLSYILAVAYKAKQGADYTSIAEKLGQMETTFFDTLSVDAYSPQRITNVY